MPTISATAAAMSATPDQRRVLSIHATSSSERRSPESSMVRLAYLLSESFVK